MRFLLLGALGIEVAPDAIDTLDGRQAILLAELLAAECHTIPVDRLMEEMFREAPPGNAKRALIAHIARLRRKLEKWEPGGPSAERISYGGRGYALKVAPAETDMGQFLSGAAQASEILKSDPEKAIPILESALALWRGPVLDGSHNSLAIGRLATRLEEVRLKAAVELAAARIDTGGGADAITDLEILLQEHPYNERVADLLMIALQRQGRITDAAQKYQSFRRRFIDDLGVDPHSALSERMTKILSNSEKSERLYPAPHHESGQTQQGRAKPDCLRRIEAFADPGSFISIGSVPSGIGLSGTAAVGICMVYDRPVALLSLAGSPGKPEAEAVQRVHEHARQAGIPLITISSPAECTEVDDLDSYAAILRSSIGLGGNVPRIAVTLERNIPCCDNTAISNDVTIVAGNGARERFEGIFLVAEDEGSAYTMARKLLSYLPGMPPGPTQCDTTAGRAPTIPADFRDAHHVIRGLADPGSMLELWPDTATNIITTLIKIDGLTLGVVANQPKVLNGRLSPEASRKGASFVTMCSTFGIALLSLVDTPGVAGDTRPGNDRHVDQLFYAFCAAQVPRFTVVVGRAHGRAYLAMNSRSAGANAVYAWPGAGIEYRSTEVDDIIAPERTRQVLRMLLRSPVAGSRHTGTPAV
jgi:acetyl-CoA carboxylase carboxyltransferase component/DNA-binding SARP family transcriptional activator